MPPALDPVTHPVSLSFRPLFDMRAELDASLDGGAAAHGRRVLNTVAGGSFEGTALRGALVPGSGDWMLTRSNGVMVIDARVVLKTEDGAIIHMTYGGRVSIPGDVLPDVRNPDTRHLIDPGRYYIRTAPVFETGAERYQWLNDIVCVGTGRLLQGRGIAYSIFQVL